LSPLPLTCFRQGAFPTTSTSFACSVAPSCNPPVVDDGLGLLRPAHLDLFFLAVAGRWPLSCYTTRLIVGLLYHMFHLIFWHPLLCMNSWHLLLLLLLFLGELVPLDADVLGGLRNNCGLDDAHLLKLGDLDPLWTNLLDLLGWHSTLVLPGDIINCVMTRCRLLFTLCTHPRIMRENWLGWWKSYSGGHALALLPLVNRRLSLLL